MIKIDNMKKIEKTIKKYNKIIFVRRTQKTSFVGIVLRAKSWFSRASVVKF